MVTFTSRKKHFKASYEHVLGHKNSTKFYENYSTYRQCGGKKDCGLMQAKILLAFLIWEWPTTIACTVQNSFPNDFHLLEACHLPCISLQLLSHLLLEAIALPLDKTWALEIDNSVTLSKQTLFPVPREQDLLCLEALLNCYHSTV